MKPVCSRDSKLENDFRSQLETSIAAIACEDASVTCILPFVGNIIDMLSQTIEVAPPLEDKDKREIESNAHDDKQRSNASHARKVSTISGLIDSAPNSTFAEVADLSRRTEILHPENFRTCLRILFICHVMRPSRADLVARSPRRLLQSNVQSIAALVPLSAGIQNIYFVTSILSTYACSSSLNPAFYNSSIEYVMLILSSLREYFRSRQYSRHQVVGGIKDPNELLGAFGYNAKESDISSNQLNYDINGVVLHSSLFVCAWSRLETENTTEQVAIWREIVYHVNAVLLWRHGKDQVVIITLAMIKSIIRKSHVCRKAFCDRGGIRTFLASLQWLSVSIVPYAIAVLSECLEYPRLANEVKASSGYLRLMQLALKMQTLPRDAATWLGALIVGLAGVNGDGDEPAKLKDYSQLLVKVVNHKVTSISPFILTCLWRMSLIPETKVVLIHVGCIEALLLYLKRSFAFYLESFYAGSTHVALGIIWRLVADESISIESDKFEILDVLLGILKIQTERVAHELRKVAVEMIWYICVSEPKYMEHVIKRGVHSILLRFMLDVNDDAIPPYLRVAAGGLFLYMYLNVQVGPAFCKLCGKFGKKEGLLEILCNMINTNDRECQVFAAKSVGYICVTPRLRARARELGVIEKLVPFEFSRRSLCSLDNL